MCWNNYLIFCGYRLWDQPVIDKQDQHFGTGKIQEVDGERKKLLLKIHYTLGIIDRVTCVRQASKIDQKMS